MSKVPILIPMYDRPEFLRETIRTLNACRVKEGFCAAGYLDKHEDRRVSDACRQAFSALEMDKTLVEWDVHRGGGHNIVEGILDLYHQGHDWFLYLESDVIVCKSYLERMAELRRICDGYEDAYQLLPLIQKRGLHHLVTPDPSGFAYRFRWTYSLGVGFMHRSLGWFASNIMEYLEDPAGFAEAHRAKACEAEDISRYMYLSDGSYFNRAWGGMLALDMAVNGRTCYASVYHPLCCHIGTYGWHGQGRVFPSDFDEEK